MILRYLLPTILVVLAFSAGQIDADHVDFESIVPTLSEGDSLTGRIAGLTFTNTVIVETGGTAFRFGGPAGNDQVNDLSFGSYCISYFSGELESFGATFDVGTVSNFSLVLGDVETTEKVTVSVFDSTDALLQTIVKQNGADGSTQLVSFSVSGIKRFSITRQPATFFGVDNIQFTPSAVPEPTSLLMFGIAMVGLTRRRREA